MVRTSPRQQVLRKVGAALVHSIEAHASAIRSRDADRACDSTTEDEDEDSLLDDSLAVDWDTEDVLGFFSDWDSDGDSASSVSSMSEDDDTEDDLSRHILLAARFYDSLSALRTLHPRRDKRTFRRLVRVLPEAFNHLISILTPHEIFANKDPRRSQAPVAEQLAVTLYWLGRNGNGGEMEDVALACGCAEGSVHLFVRRVVDALYDARVAALCWASQEERQEAQNWVAQRVGCPEWTHGWCMTDGSQIPLAFAPSKQAHQKEYFDRKNQYALNLQATILPTTLRIIDFVAGYKGSTQDSRAFAASDVVRQPRRYLEEGDFIWVDGGYGLSSFTCGPYDHVVGAKSRDFRTFNGAVSNIRVRSEHAFGYLKGRFQALRGLRVLIRNEREHHRAVKTVVAAMVAHNIALQFDGQDERRCFMDLTGVSGEALAAWEQLQEPDNERDQQKARAWAERVRAQKAFEAREKARQQSTSARQLDIIRKEDAKKLRERLHVALFAARDREFQDTTAESRMMNLTYRELQARKEAERQRLEARRARKEAERAQRTIQTRGRGRGRGGGKGRDRSSG